MWFVGLDVPLRRTSVCILDANGKLVKQALIRGPVSKAVEALGAVRPPWVVCYEASCGYGHLYDQLHKIARRVVVAHPGHLRLIFRSKKKNDRVDARKLATLLFLDQVPTVYVPNLDVRSWRSLIGFRGRLVAKRTRAKNAVRAVLRAEGVETPWGPQLWTKKGQTWLAELELSTRRAALQRDLLVDEIAHPTAQLRAVERELDATAQRHPGVTLLRTIPGIGPRTAEAFVAYVDDARRFGRNKAIGSYFGLVPCQDESAGKNRLGHITREGPSVVRKLVTEAAWQARRRSAHVPAYFERIRHDDPDRTKLALVATAHYLLRCRLAMLQTGEAWRYDAKPPEDATVPSATPSSTAAPSDATASPARTSPAAACRPAAAAVPAARTAEQAA